jgi:hypothetical protein
MTLAVSAHQEVITLFILNPEMAGAVDTPRLLYHQQIKEVPTETLPPANKGGTH